MKASDYIAEFLAINGINDVFGYPGGMVTHLIDSLESSGLNIRNHICYHEQAASFAACGYAQAGAPFGVVYATSGPGATNLITGICNAYFDSIPLLVITGQVNTFEQKGELGIRQRGFQETDIVSMCKPVTKECVAVHDVDDLPEALEHAVMECVSRRPGPVLLDVPMNIQRAEIKACPRELTLHSSGPCFDERSVERYIEKISNDLAEAERPCILIGQGVKSAGCISLFRKALSRLNVPVVSSMLSIDICPEYKYYYGFIGAYGDRIANFVVAKSDYVLVLGSRCDVRQVGANREKFAPQARIARVDIDDHELNYRIHDDDFTLNCDLRKFLELFDETDPKVDCPNWLETCEEMRLLLSEVEDEQYQSSVIKDLSAHIPSDWSITTDVGQNQVWIAQYLEVKDGQRVLFSGGHGAMGYSLPAAIGAYYATNRPIVCFVGDGGMQMNIQELAYLKRENIPVNVVVLNNSSLGMIRHFQEMYFDARYYGTMEGTGYSSPDFMEIAKAYGIDATCIKIGESIPECVFSSDMPRLIVLELPDFTYVFPKLEFGKPNQDQEPLLDRSLYDYLMSL